MKKPAAPSRAPQGAASAGRKGKDLTPKEQIFVRELLKHGNGTKAATVAGYSAATASVTASKLLRKAKVAAELAKLRQKLLEKIEIDAEKVLQGIAELAFYDIRKFFKPTGELIPVRELDGATAKALKGCDVEKLFKHFGKGQAEETGTITKIRTADRLEALEMLGRHLKLFTDKIEINDAQAIILKLQQGRARVAAMKN
jgi:phage terminase small subunit